MPPPSHALRSFGEGAALLALAGPDQAQALAASLVADRRPWLLAAVPGLQSLLVEFDPLRTNAADVGRELLERLASLPGASPARGRVRTIPVVYGGEFGPDLEEVATIIGGSTDDVIRLHAAAELRVLFDGFAPGFAYLGELPEQLRVPRLATPRTRTPRGSVAIAGAMSGIYPADLPGGWRVIGRTPIELFDPDRDPPAYLVSGDTVRVRPIAPADWDRHAGAPNDW
ncbi:MAG: 5-oxoprolinase subunit PxpB [Chloroflexi bacterium]|nr:5-oxoprolinase subunit PxpB [Chloroflexota bacterium]